MLAHIERWEPQLHATYALDPERRAGDGARLRSALGAPATPLGALDGVPVTIKENIATRGVPMPLGTAATELVPAAEDAPPAAAAARSRRGDARQDDDARLRHAVVGPVELSPAGAQSLGPEQGRRAARAPARARRAAAGYGPLHIGTDIGGSMRLPAGWCGIFGLKPSNGRIPIEPPYYGRVAGPMTRSVGGRGADDAGAVAARRARHDEPAAGRRSPGPSTAARQLKGLRIGLLLDAGWGLAVEPESARRRASAAARAFEARRRDRRAAARRS